MARLPREAQILSALAEASAPMTIGEIANLIGASPHRAQKILQLMKCEGAVEFVGVSRTGAWRLSVAAEQVA